ncbi:Hypothetical protein POVR2_LOCUS387 [uncultured virus]|nr:Hypothetical protein POVR2_LOCUS387 [uncultured virus]
MTSLPDAPAYYDVMNRLDVPSVELPVELADLVERISRAPREVGAETSLDCPSIEIYSDRPFFALLTPCYRTTCQVGKNFLLDRTCSDKNEGDPIYVSAVDIYDKYGIRIVHAFLYQLLSRVKLYDIQAIALYLIGSLAVLNEHDLYVKLLERPSTKHREDNLLQTINKSCHKLLELFRDTEAMYPINKSVERVTQELPVELLAIIFKSTRVNKATRGIYLASRQGRELRAGEMAIRACYLSVSRVERSKHETYACERDVVTIDNGYHFKRHNLLCRPVSPTVVSYSWKDIAEICYKPEIETFEAMTSKLDLTDGSRLCVLILLLQHREPLKHILAYRSVATKILSHSELVDLYLRLREGYLEEFSASC